ncbi:MAG TPA: Sua5/YciO/YrdC/YwlC family protein [Candidatus Cloacimonadota bacterium]|nr:Sua5/YciO/YrdC/YwlC family protein [Candidatus Cloacimonadota bacterium]
MERLKNPSPRKLSRFLAKRDLSNATILHYTGHMWGIGALLSAQSALDRINKLKQRTKSGMIVLIPDQSWFAENGIKVPHRLEALMQQYFPGNLSIAFKVDDPRFESVSVNGKVAFRVPTDPLLRAFLELTKEALVSSSINYSNLPAENDLKRIEKVYGSWFDVALIPQDYGSGKGISTLVEHISAQEAGIEDIKCLREGSVPFYEVKQSFSMPLVMFVCTANICRSPIAEKLFRKMVENSGLPLSVDSSGLIEGGHMISLSSMQLLMEAGIPEAQEHVSKQITPQMVAGSWLVLTMEERQRDYLRERNPESMHKILTLNEITGFEGDVEDPYGSDIDNYRTTYMIIQERLIILHGMILKKEIKL